MKKLEIAYGSGKKFIGHINFYNYSFNYQSIKINETFIILMMY